MTVTEAQGRAELVGQFPVGSAEWHAARAEGLGGSEIAPVLGLSPHESPFSLWHRKAGVIGPVEQTPEMEWGTRLEPVIIAKFLEDHPEWWGTGTATFRNTARPWQIANPDQVLDPVAGRGSDGPDGPSELLEVKTAYSDELWGEPGTDEIPVYYRTQVLWYLDVFALERCHVAALISGSDYREYIVTYDPAEAQLLRDAGRAFLDSIAANDRPDIDAHAATYTAIRTMHPDIVPVDVELDVDLARRYVTARHALTAATEAADEYRSRVADAMGPARRAVWQGHTIASRQARGLGTPYVVVGRRLPDLASIPASEEIPA